MHLNSKLFMQVIPGIFFIALGFSTVSVSVSRVRDCFEVNFYKSGFPHNNAFHRFLGSIMSFDFELCFNMHFHFS